MKKIVLILGMVLPNLMGAQVAKDSTKSKVETDFYIGVSFNANQSLNLNQKLRNGNLPEMRDVTPELTFGLNFLGEKYSGDLELGTSFLENKKGDNTLKYLGLNSRARFNYNLIHKPKVTLATGLSLAYQTNRYDLYSNNNSTDLNVLAPELNSGHVNLENRMFYVGPTATVYLFKKSSFKLRLNLGYDFALTRGKYRSEYGSITNNIRENGNNRFVFGIAFM
ncbi:hypothetical protein [Flavobacterium sp. N1719]|uniref:hypothetical protein n=1 Tax=Flavobacterium sp. N1719 TaxID=2885633 RepID=UPI002222BA87|nr:hypothetical protein [Flavobacterium sp. N1719]